MASTITALTSSGGVAFAGDTTGALELKTNNGTTAVTIDTSQNVTLANPLSPASGGTGVSSITAENVVLGNGTGAVKVVAPGSNGNVLTSNGTTWVSQALPAGGVTSLNGQTGAITNTTLYAIGSYITGRPANSTGYAVDSTIAGSSLYATGAGVLWVSANSFFINYAGVSSITSGPAALINTGTWRCVSPASANSTNAVGISGLWVRIS